MFNSKSGSDGSKSTSSSGMPNHINSDTVIEGSIKARGNLRIDGKLTGTLECQGRVVIGASGVIEGDIKCENAEIEGSLKANITVSDLLSLKSTAKVQGDIITKKLAIEPGATFTGSCSMGGVVKDISSSNAGQSREEQRQEKTA
ncbi:MAG: polymer-forming cytoskeletal protein [Flavobacteriales bacterium]|nr:polymer-forming cytoskeletal protein [Flavobacteriales bacterium]MCB9191677.1 polymer-forming cytoskeletal protein [Flavobacteriales bacterium]MCB9203669.1 polymer-forming cytoskeletal protein [Flavobacteriales bacterium]